MNKLTTDLLEELKRLRILTPPHQELLHRLPRKEYAPRVLAQYIVRQGWLTPFQANQVVSGHGAALILGPYVLLERLGEGGMGQVFKARQSRLERLVALKVIRRDRLNHRSVLQRFQREVLAAAQLAHPNVVRAIDADHAGSTFYFAMEFVDGVDLAHLVRGKGPLSIERACDIIRQAALGLQHVHEHGLVHRDIKPSNLMVTAAGQVKILDLGLARLDMPDEEEKGDLTREGQMIGTPEYVAPEQAVNPHNVDIRADLYSLGCTFFYLLTGQPPFPHGTPLEKFIAHRCEEPPAIRGLRPEIPVELAKVVARLLVKDPAERFQLPRDLAHALDAAGRGESLADGRSELTPTDRPLPAGKAPRRVSWPRVAVPWRWLVAGGGTLALLLIVGGAWAGGFFSSTAAPATGAEPDRLANIPVLHYLKKGSREETIVATLAGNGLPSFQTPWHIIGPFDGHGGLNRTHPPENEIDLGKTYNGKDQQKVTWQEFPHFKVGKNVGLPKRDQVCYYLLHEFEVAEAAAMRLSLGGDDTMMVWHNGEVVASKRSGGGAEPDQVLTMLSLKPGKNRLLVKVCNHGGDMAFYLCPHWPEPLQVALGGSLDRDFPRKRDR